MGNRTRLSFGNSCEFEANNCIPVTWLSLFIDYEFQLEAGTEDDPEESRDYIAVYKTTQQKALSRVKSIIPQIKNSPAWALLKPLEILRDELTGCPNRAKIRLDVTQLYYYQDSFQQRIPQAASDFINTINNFHGKEEDFRLLELLVNRYSLQSPAKPNPPLISLDSESKMFTMIGLYWGDAEKEEIYSLPFFNETYWRI